MDEHTRTVSTSGSCTMAASAPIANDGSEASALVCARGTVRAVCAGSDGAVGVRRVVATRRVVVRRR